MKILKLVRKYCLVVSPKYISYYEQTRLRRIPKFTPCESYLLNKKMKLVNSKSFLRGVCEIFEKGMYAFQSSSPDPIIIDCGANIGLSVLYFKNKYPLSQITAFEPDKNIFDALQFNVLSHGFSDIVLHNSAVWISDGDIKFQQEGGLSGRIPKQGDDSDIVKVKTTRLRNLLDQRIDLLKIDIEGAEFEVIKDCADHLDNVSMLFIEYHSHIHEQQTLHEILAILQKSGFRYHIKEEFSATYPFIERSLMLGMDLQLGIYAFRI